MAIDLSLHDTFYPFEGFDHIRNIARAIIMDDNGGFAIHRIHRVDIFGDVEYPETPGGGVDEGESFEEAVIRECEEETGYRVEVISFLGEVRDYYNLIKRKNVNRFYLCKAKTFVGKHFASSGDGFIQKTEFLPIEEIISLYESLPEEGIRGIIRQRELPIWLEAKRVLKK
ncbi:MAG: NUDIX hydrolase [Bacilli bacterium]|nr:NUDIX hydrolase [Bacilli bacterium]